MQPKPYKILMAAFSTLVGFAITYAALNLEASPVAVETWLVKPPVAQINNRAIAALSPQEEIGALFQKAREHYISGELKECAETLKTLQDKVSADVKAVSF